MKAQLDPTGQILSSWNTAFSLQPCPAYGGQPTGRMASAGVWTGVACSDSATLSSNTLSLSGSGKAASALLQGSIPVQARSDILARWHPLVSPGCLVDLCLRPDRKSSN